MTDLTIFTSPTCGPCRILKPELRELCNDLDITLEERDISRADDKAAALAAGVRGVPAVIHNSTGTVLFTGNISRAAIVDVLQARGII
ncbi:hypothetical protein GFK26_18450 [Variovorax paradoxus]|uniref:Thioredoxin domain-containing protein n=1 Tax=Variovorax paradoxus TaxID=34073 RepID=A0A5Q0M546_VARPD|nr:thioredoxin domain-containing protein [Variovorax paradoxus]QFZ84609.1 hypothetical protein GFK26_18450 [Variovorax paradoxus]